MVYHTEISNHLDQNIGIIWHKRSMFVNDNTAEYNKSLFFPQLFSAPVSWGTNAIVVRELFPYLRLISFVFVY